MLPTLIRFNTQPPEGGWDRPSYGRGRWCSVSTHSRPKAAGAARIETLETEMRFNTQPPEGGWLPLVQVNRLLTKFQHTAARRRLGFSILTNTFNVAVSTHSRPKAAGRHLRLLANRPLSFNTQPPEGGWVEKYKGIPPYKVSTHSRPKAAGSAGLINKRLP